MRKSVAAKAVLGVALVAIVATACSSSKKSTSSGGGGGTTAASSSGPAASPATGSEVKLLIMAVRNTPVLAQQEQFDAAQARVDYLNDHGGVNGHKLTLEVCDTKLDPNAEQACIDKAVSDKVSAVVGSTILFSSLKNLETAQIPLIGAQGITPVQLQSKISFPFGSIFAWFGGQVQMAKQDGAKTVAISYLQTDSSKFSAGIMTSEAPKAGLKIVANVGSALTTTDYTADAATLIKDNPDAVLISGSTGTAPGLIKALKSSGYQGKIYCLSADFKEEDLKTFKSVLEGTRIASVAKPLSSDDAGVVAYKADIAKYAPKAKQDENGMLGWSGVDLYAQIMKNATAFTGADVIAAAEKVTTPITAGPYGPWVGAGTSPLPDYPRLFNHNFVPGTIKNGEIVADGDFTDAIQAG